MAVPGTEGQNGLTHLATTAGRAAAMYYAIITSNEQTTDPELFDRANRFELWINGLPAEPAAVTTPRNPYGAAQF